MRRLTHQLSVLLIVPACLAGWAACPRGALAGDVYAWGNNDYGQIGDGTSTRRTLPVPVHGAGNIGFLTGVNSIAGGGLHSMALRADGSVLAWGYNQYGELGDGTNTNRNLPVAVHGVGNVGLLTGVRSIAAGGTHSLAVRADGTALAWGYNGLGCLGDGTNTHRSTPVAIHGVGNVGLLSNVSFMAGGYAHTLVRLNDGTAVAMGLNNVGEVGDGTTINRNLPVAVVGLSNVVSLSGGDTHSVGALADGSAWGWGGNGGRLGDGTMTDRTTPVPVHGEGNVGTLANVVSVAAGGLHSLALLSDGTVRAWGRNTDGELGDGTNTLRLAPVMVPGLSNIVQVGASIHSSFALSADGRLWSWGRNADGELGVGDLINRNTPVEVLAPAGMRFEAIAPAVDGLHTVALVSSVPAPGAGVLLALGAMAVRRRRRSVRTGETARVWR